MIETTTTHRLAAFIAGGADALVTEAVRHQAHRAILDTLAVTLAGGVDPAVRRLENSLEEASSPAACPSPWTGRRHGVTDTALLLGMAAHMDDYDDVSMLAVCHPSAPVLSALLAVQGGSRAASASGHDFVTAFAVGTEVLIRLGQAMGFRHYELGFHATSTLGAVGAAAAVARLVGLDAARTAHALAISASMAGGLRKNFGTMVKPLHVGLAASSGVRAVLMAAAGVEGASEPFEANGYLQAFSGGATDQFPAEYLEMGRPFAIEQPGFEQKRYPCCYLLHKMIEATLRLRQAAGCTLSDVERVHVRMPRGGTKPLIHPYPRSGLNGKFSGPYAVAAALADGRIDLASFSDESVLRDPVQRRLRDITVEEAGDAPPPGTDLGRMPVTVSLTLRDGRVLEHTVLAPPGSPEDPMTSAQLRDKWTDCVVHGLPALDRVHAAALFERGMGLAQEQRAGDWLSAVFGAAAK